MAKGVMLSCANKDKEVANSSKGFKWLRRGVTPRSSAPRAPPARRFGAQDIEEHGLKWFNEKKRPNTTWRTRLMKAGWKLSSHPSLTSSIDWGWDMCLQSHRSVTSL
ncbi:hypothetical protein HAX54_022710 [Datura stramonium]|uniref:Uncharacterized protein n=1 Tax=Datura stramonium TaxID=4076 RepID=A0ABS8UUS2_DATST|nr:hypothetical protein [Datura stramonium]